jgi:hypothetical protein
MTAGSAPSVAVIEVLGARTVTCLATGLSVDTTGPPAGPGWTRIDSVVPSSRLGHD